MLRCTPPLTDEPEGSERREFSLVLALTGLLGDAGTPTSQGTLAPAGQARGGPCELVNGMTVDLNRNSNPAHVDKSGQGLVTVPPGAHGTSAGAFRSTMVNANETRAKACEVELLSTPPQPVA